MEQGISMKSFQEFYNDSLKVLQPKGGSCGKKKIQSSANSMIQGAGKLLKMKPISKSKMQKLLKISFY